MKLRYMEGYDAGRIVSWRNANSEFFPPQEPWTVEGHLHWYAKYLTDMDDFVHMVCLDNGTPVGTIGVTRHSEGHHELGRVMFGDRTAAPSGIMSEALQAVMILHEAPYYWLRVLKGNDRAISFYEKNGFRKFDADELYTYMSRSNDDSAV